MTKVKAGNVLPHITENRRLRKSKYKDIGLPEARFLTPGSFTRKELPAAAAKSVHIVLDKLGGEKKSADDKEN